MGEVFLNCLFSYLFYIDLCIDMKVIIHAMILANSDKVTENILFNQLDAYLL